MNRTQIIRRHVTPAKVERHVRGSAHEGVAVAAQTRPAHDRTGSAPQMAHVRGGARTAPQIAPVPDDATAPQMAHVRGGARTAPQIAPVPDDATAPQIRPVYAGDHDAISAFFAGLSPGTRYLRFFTGAAPATGAMLRLLSGEGDNADVVVASAGSLIIGHAMAVDRKSQDGTRLADVGVVVAGEWQNRGIGTALLRMLTDRAHARGASLAVMDVLAENRRVLAQIRRHWPDATFNRSGISVTFFAHMPQGSWADGAAKTATST